MVNSVAEFNDVLEDLEKIKILKSYVCSIVSLHKRLEAAKKSSKDQYYSGAKNLVEFDRIFQELAPDGQKDIKIMGALRGEYHIVREELTYQIENVWNKNIVFSDNVEGKSKRNVSLTITKEIKYEEIFKSLFLLDYLRPILKGFGDHFLRLVCRVVILNDVTIKCVEEDVSYSLKIQILNEQSRQPSKVFEALKTVFKFIKHALFQFPVVFDGHSESTAMNELGAVISEDFCSLLIDNCLKTAIPKQSRQLKAFEEEIAAAENFSNELQVMGFLSKPNNPLQKFITNVDILPANKIAQDILSRARDLMKKSLHITCVVGVESSPIAEVESSDHLNEMARTKNGLSRSTFLFPKCQISVFMKELVKLLIEVKEEAKSVPNHAVRLYNVSRSICELYCCVVPTFHKDKIESIPQQTAIFHNNCMYLAYHLSTFSISYKSDLQPEIPCMTFVDLIPEIKKLGAEAFLAQMRHQRKQLLQLIQEHQAFQNIMVGEEMVNKTEKSIRQCLCQLQLLQRAWSDILPIEVYFKSIGTLFNSCLEETIQRVLSAEDISAEAAAQMDRVFAIFLKQGPELFKVAAIDKRDFVHMYVKRWFKFQELQLLLSASMIEIVDRWSSGKGPLAAHFSADEVKHLIRALFQNTERRAAALAKIR